MSELKKCPFCGGALRTMKEDGKYLFYCWGCGVQSDNFYDSREEAIEAANRRIE